MKPSNDYVAHQGRFLAEFNLLARFSYPVLLKQFDRETARRLLTETRLEFFELIPQLPYIGGKQPFTQFIVFTGIFLAVYRTLKLNGKTVEQTGALIYEICSHLLKFPMVRLLQIFTPLNFTRSYYMRLKKRAADSHAREYPDDYVYNYIEGDGITFDYGVDYLECASCKFLAAQGATELAPYLCPVDILYSEALGWGLTRTMTLAEGAEKCDFRFKKGGKTTVAVPAALLPIVTKES